ncbi:MAG: discoidin domain-containing protein [Bacteroidota bacterium]
MKAHCSLLVVLAVFLTIAAHGAGLVKNSDFVTRVAGNAAQAADWKVSTDAAAAYTVVDDDGYKDSHSLHYKGEAERKSGPVTQAVTLRKGTDYVLVAALKSDGVLKPAVRLMGPQGQLAVVVSDGSKTWTPFSARFNSGEATAATIEAFGDAGLTAQGPYPGGASAIDAVQVYPASEVPATANAEAAFVAPGPNIALGKPYTLQPAPNYGLSADAGDKTQLTDGEYTVGYFWAQKTTVGWSGANPVIVTIDLGKVEPIAGMAYDTAAGVASVSWPTSILIMVSDDGKTWTSAGDLINLATKASGPPPPTPYAVHKFATDQLKTHARFVKLFVEQTPYAFVDEIEVYQGPQTYLQVPLGPTVDDPLKLFNDRIVYGGMMWRLRTDLSLARKAIAESKVPEAQKAALLDKANALAPRIEAMPTEVPKSFRTILPLNDLHAEIYALYAPLQRARGLKPLTVWANSRWDMLQPTEAPEKQPAAPSVAVRMMQREYRGATFNLSNTTDNPMTVTFNLNGLPGGTNPDYVSVRDIPFTDTRDRVPVADALPEIRAGANGYRVSIPAGMVKQIWLDFRPMDVKPGEYKGEIALRSARADNATIPLSFRVQSQVFPARPTIHIGGWDYLETLKGTYDAVPTNVPDFLKVLPANYIDTPWAGGGVQPSGGTFDPDGRLTNELNFTNWDRWIGLWPGARRYAVFLSVPDSFAGEKMGTPRFN